MAKAAYSHAATQPRRHRSSVSSNRLQLSYFKLGVRGLLIRHFQQADLKLAQHHDNLLSLSAVLKIT